MADQLAHAVTPHPIRRVAYGAYVIGGACAAFGVVELVADATVGPVFFGLGAFFVAYGGWVNNVGKGAQVLNKALNLASSGKLAEAEALLAWGERAIRRGRLDRPLAIQRALIAMRRGDVARALEHADAAASRPPSLLMRRQDAMQRVAALGLRAVLRASNGDGEGARADAALVRKSPDALPESLARAALAEAIVLERAGQLGALKSHLAAERQLLLGSLKPRERALVRAYARMLRAPASTAYRTAAPREDERAGGDEPALEDWVAKIAPAAAAFVPRVRAPAEGIVAPAAEPGALAKARARKPVRRRRWGRLLALWAAIVVAFTAFWQFFSPSTEPVPVGARPEDIADSGFFPLALMAVCLAVIVASLVVIVRSFRGLAATRRLVGTLAAVARGDAAARVDLEELARSSMPIVAAQARHQLAGHADRAGDFETQLEHAEAGLAALASPALRMVSSDYVYPNLCVERAFALLALGRRDEALAEVALVAEQFPSFPFMARATFRVSLVDAIQRGEFDVAGSIASVAAELPITPREELLADVARAVASPESVGANELARVREELTTDAESAAWVRAVARPLVDAFWRGDAEKGELFADEQAREAEAEAEAAAELEAYAATGLSAARAR